MSKVYQQDGNLCRPILIESLIPGAKASAALPETECSDSSKGKNLLLEETAVEGILWVYKGDIRGNCVKVIREDVGCFRVT